MKRSKRKFFSGNTLQQAVVAAAVEHGLETSQVAYRQLEKRHGFLKTPRRVVIAVDPEAPRLPEGEVAVSDAAAPATFPSPAPSTEVASSDGPVDPTTASPGDGGEVPTSTRAAAPREESSAQGRSVPGDGIEGERPASRAPGSRGPASRGPESRMPDSKMPDSRSPEPEGDGARDAEAGSQERPGRERRSLEPEDRSKLRSAAGEAMEKIVAVSGLELSWTVKDTEEGIMVELEGADAELLLEENGKAIFAMEHLLPKLVRGRSGQRAYCHIDCLDFKARRLEELTEMALRWAKTVKETGEPKTLDLLNPAERRHVHMSLAQAEGVETESEGRGYLKKLTIWPMD